MPIWGIFRSLCRKYVNRFHLMVAKARSVFLIFGLWALALGPGQAESPLSAIDWLSQPVATVGYKPDQVKEVGDMEGTKVDQVYIGSCTNGRIEDLREAAAILRGRTIANSVRGILVPATPTIYSQALDEGLIRIFLDSGFCVMNPTCGACLGMSSGVLADGEVCASTTNRNFNGRMGKGGMVHLMSPASAAAAAITGAITDPRRFMD